MEKAVLTAGENGTRMGWMRPNEEAEVAEPDAPEEPEPNPPIKIVNGIFYIHRDHLGSSSLTTDEQGAIKQLVDYFPYGSTHFQEDSEDYENDKLYTGKELDEELGLYYYGARYYHAEIGRFLSQDPSVLAVGSGQAEQTDKEKTDKILLDPHKLNLYTYSRNNPLKYVDPTGNYWETALDILSLALSSIDYYRAPGFWTAAWVAVDAIGIALPIPNVVGYVRNSERFTKAVQFFSRYARQSDKNITEFVTTLAKNVSFQQTKLLWTTGDPGDSLVNLVGHFVKHGAEVGAKTLEEYYTKANQFVFSEKNYVWREYENYQDDIIHFDPITKIRAISTPGGEIRTFHRIDDPYRLEQYNQKVEDLKRTHTQF